MAGLATFRQQYPQYGEVPDDTLADALYAKFYSHVPREEFDSAMAGAQEPAEGSIADLPLGLVGAATYGVRSVTDLFGAENIASQGLRSAEEALSGMLSAQAKNDQEQLVSIFEEAEDKGWGAQLGAAWEEMKTAPGMTLAQALGTSIPVIGGGLVGAALKVGTRAIPVAIGAAMGAGIIKGSIYDTVRTIGGRRPRKAG